MGNNQSTGKKAAVVTGASRGIGRATAIRLAEEGFAVAVNFVSNQDAANQVVEEIVQQGGETVAVQASIAEEPDRERIVNAALERFGRIDVLVNNAGITSPGRLDVLEATSQNWDTVFNTNLKGPFFLSQRAAKEMIRLRQSGELEQGTIINVSSISSYAVSANRPDYCIAKAGMAMMTLLFADRLAAETISVYEVCPGVIRSDMTAPVAAKYDRLIEDGMTPIRRWGEPEDVAEVIGRLASAPLPFCTGQRFDVDGGFHIRRL